MNSSFHFCFVSKHLLFIAYNFHFLRKYSIITPLRKNRLLDFCAMVLFIEKMQLKMQLSQNLCNKKH